MRVPQQKSRRKPTFVLSDENKLWQACQVEIFYLSKKLSSKKLRTQSNRLFYAITCLEHGKRNMPDDKMRIAPLDKRGHSVYSIPTYIIAKAFRIKFLHKSESVTKC